MARPPGMSIHTQWWGGGRERSSWGFGCRQCVCNFAVSTNFLPETRGLFIPLGPYGRIFLHETHGLFSESVTCFENSFLKHTDFFQKSYVQNSAGSSRYFGAEGETLPQQFPTRELRAHLLRGSSLVNLCQSILLEVFHRGAYITYPGPCLYLRLDAVSDIVVSRVCFKIP